MSLRISFLMASRKKVHIYKDIHNLVSNEKFLEYLILTDLFMSDISKLTLEEKDIKRMCKEIDK